jgi:hypothetical protein
MIMYPWLPGGSAGLHPGETITPKEGTMWVGYRFLFCNVPEPITQYLMLIGLANAFRWKGQDANGK